MTEKDALEKILEVFESEHTGLAEFMKTTEEWKIVKRAVEKQIAKKTKSTDYAKHCCPNCKRIMFVCTDYCSGCGQKIIWGKN